MLRPQLALEPIGGLGNRMRAIDSALALARRLDTPLTVFWRRTADLDCAFRDLFEALPGALVVEWSAVSAWATGHRGASKTPTVSFARIVLQAEVERLTTAGADFAE